MASDDDTRFEERIGTSLRGKWTLEKLLGVGGMAAVYAARHRIGNEVAIKILHPEVARSKELCLRFEREAKVANRLRHPGAVAVTDVDTTEEGVPFMVMELLHGEPLSALFRRPEGVPTDDVLRYLDELLDVLTAAHAQGIVHRDIKFDNLFVTDTGSLKVLDFGIARLRDGMPMTVHGAMLGTLPYMPPEQAKGLSIDGRADLFAVGAVLFRLVARRRIHSAKTEPELLVKMTTEPAPPLSSVAPDSTQYLCLVTDRALAFDREKRYPDAATMQEDVQALRRGEAPPYATRKLAEAGPPNPLVQPGEAAGPTPRALTVATRAAAPVAVIGSPDQLDTDPCEPTAVARPQESAGPLSATAATGPVATVPAT
ncbi:MAG: serine/threonine protein kinase, partial [Deltaproteobacteria bacterium]